MTHCTNPTRITPGLVDVPGHRPGLHRGPHLHPHHHPAHQAGGQGGDGGRHGHVLRPDRAGAAGQLGAVQPGVQHHRGHPARPHLPRHGRHLHCRGHHVPHTTLHPVQVRSVLLYPHDPKVPQISCFLAALSSSRSIVVCPSVGR